MQQGLRLVQQLSLRHVLAERLEQKHEQQLKLEMTLRQYLDQEDLISGMIRYADEHKTWRTFDKNGFSFSFAGLPYKVAQPIADIAGCGFAHCLYNPFGKRETGDWALFVVEDRVPDTIADMVALHERGEELSLGNHFFASKLEWAYAQHRKQTRQYAAFIDRHYPSKFVDLTQEVLFPILPLELIEILEQQGRRNKQELATAEALIKKYPLPTSVLKKMDAYEELTLAACDEVQYAIGKAQHQLSWRPLMTVEEQEVAAKMVDLEVSAALRITAPNDFRKLSPNRVQEMYDSFFRFVSRDFHARTRRHLAFPETVADAYRQAMRNERIVTVRDRRGPRATISESAVNTRLLLVKRYARDTRPEPI